MPVITLIKQQKDHNRVNVYLDGKFGFGIDLENFVKLGLRVEQELTQLEVDKITKKAEFQRSFEKLLRFAMVRPRSKKEILDWFKRKKILSGHEDLLIKLEKFNLLNDENFAKWWVEQRQQFRPKPIQSLKNELRIKGISKEIIEKILSETKVDELDLAKRELVKNKYKWTKFEKFKVKRKMGEFLARKGYGWEVIKQAISFQIDDGEG